MATRKCNAGYDVHFCVHWRLASAMPGDAYIARECGDTEQAWLEWIRVGVDHPCALSWSLQYSTFQSTIIKFQTIGRVSSSVLLLWRANRNDTRRIELNVSQRVKSSMSSQKAFMDTYQRGNTASVALAIWMIADMSLISKHLGRCPLHLAFFTQPAMFLIPHIFVTKPRI